jgi:outer membrane protein assembly factor BamA
VYSLFPIYRELGQLKASFGQPVARPEESANCKGGVDLTIPVVEGSIYSWANAEWTGNQVLIPQDLDAALGMKTGEVANGLKFDKGVDAVFKAYGRKGYLDLRLKSQPEFDDSGLRVAYKIAITEGPQYRMGNLIVKGFPAASEKLLRQKWQLKTGDVFDEGYLDDFLKKDFGEISRLMAEAYNSQGKPLPKKLGGSYEPNRQTLTVDVTFETGK